MPTVQNEGDDQVCTEWVQVPGTGKQFVVGEMKLQEGLGEITWVRKTMEGRTAQAPN